jgi:glycine/D-amino acid oxidase-like deaminating enzyme
MHNTFGDLVGAPVEHKECLQTFTADQNFIIDHHPEESRVILCSPCSGHGFKFTPVMGEILKEMVEGKSPSLDTNLFRLNRLLAS